MFGQRKYNWRNALKSLLFLAGFAAYGGLYGNHMLGGEVSYTHQGGKKYKFTVRLYTDCNGGCVFNTAGCADVKNLDVYVSPEEITFAKKITTISLTKVSRKDITPMCPGSLSVCNGGPFPEGLEEWIYEGSLDFDGLSTDYCKYEVAIRIDSRSDVWSSGGNDAFYNFARVNTCDTSSNNSPNFQSQVYYLLPLNQSFTYNILASDPDGDSLSYKLVKAQKGWNTVVQYPSGYGPTKPLDVYCNSGCTLDKTKWPIEGMGIEEENGWMGFTPIVDGQTSFVVVEVTEWRKVRGTWTAIGVSRRDMQVRVIEANNYVPKMSSSTYDYFACAGEDFMMDFGIYDQAYGGIKDSVSLSFSSLELTGGEIKKVGSSKNQFDAFFKIPTSLLQMRKEPYYITLIATDNHCPLVANTYRTISITVAGVPKSLSTVAFKECNKIGYTTSATGNEYSHTWFLFSGPDILDTRYGASGTMEVPSPGKYEIRHQIINLNTGCKTFQYDTIEVPAFSLLKPALAWPAKVCRDEPFTLKAGFNGGTAPFNYWWNGIVGADSLPMRLAKDSAIQLDILDKNGCRLTTKENIRLFVPVDLIAMDTALCRPATPFKVSLNNRIQITPTSVPANFVFNYFGGGGQVISENQQYFFIPDKSLSNNFEFLYTDENSCHYQSQFTIKVIDPLPTGITAMAPFCNNDAAVDIQAKTGCLLPGDWKCDAVPLAVKNGYFYPALAGVGNVDLVFASNISGCIIRDTTTAIVNKAPVVYIVKPADTVFCSNSNSLYLNAFPVGGTWKNNVNSAMPNLFSPADAKRQGFSSATFEYAVADKNNGCKSTDKIRLHVNAAPTVALLSSYALCSGTDLLLEPKAAHTSSLELNGDIDGFTIQRLGESYLLAPKPTDERKVSKFTLTASGLPGCKASITNFDVVVKPVPQISLKGSPGEGCSPLYTVLQVQNLNAKAVPSEYLWAEGRNWVAGSNFKPLALIASGTYQYEVKAVLEGCTSEVVNTSVTVLVSPQAVYETEPKSRTVSADFTNLTFKDVSISTIPYTRFWAFEYGIPATSDKPRVSVDFPKDTGLYGVRLTIVTEEGCKSNVLSNIRVRPGLRFYVPNAFTPDKKGPDQNEKFRVEMDSAVTFSLTMLNRWGEVMFTANNQFTTWDGTYRGKPAPAGVYVWQIEATTIYGAFVQKRGTVTLMR